MQLLKYNYLRGSGHGDTWHVEIDPPKRKVKSYFEETVETAKYMYENKSGELYLLYSGGLDSQYVFNVYHRLGFKFKPVIIRLQGRYSDQDYNIHETQYAFDHCRSLGIKPIEYCLDVDKFIESGEAFDLAKTFYCGSWWLVSTMKVASWCDGFVTMGNDPPYLKYLQDKDEWVLEELEYIHSILKYFTINKLEGCPFLLSYTPEMMLSFLLDPRIQDLANKKYPGKLGTNSSKSYVFNNGSNFNMEGYDFTKGRKKAAGMEFLIQTPLADCEALIKHKDWEKQYRGVYYENYHSVIKKLSVNQ